MNRSILWNGFEIKKGIIQTSTAKVPYIYYSPEMSKEPVNIAIHGETYSKDEWLCFNSILKSGNLLKESIRKNSPFIAFDLYGHGDWIIEDKNFNPANMNKEITNQFIITSANCISEAIKKILKSESLDNNPITIIANSLGCSVALNLNLDFTDIKTILLSPFYTDTKLKYKESLIFRGDKDNFVSKDNFNKLYTSLPEKKKLVKYNTGHDLKEEWINKAKDFIYQIQ